MNYIVKGLGYGDEGKGSIIDFLTSGNEEYEVIKEGGPNAAHHIISKDGRYHRSEQMGSGVLNKEVRTFCSKNMIIEPCNLSIENRMLQQHAGLYDGMDRLLIDSRCPIVTPLHAMIGRLLEISREHNRYGSTGMGVGQVVHDKKEKGDAVLSIGDIYSFGMCMMYILGGDIEKNILPDSFEMIPNQKVDMDCVERIRSLILTFTNKHPKARSNDAWKAYHQLRELRIKAFGHTGFIEFRV